MAPLKTLLVGINPQETVALGQALVQANLPLVGVWSPDHNKSLVAGLKIGCLAYPKLEDIWKQADVIWLAGELPNLPHREEHHYYLSDHPSHYAQKDVLTLEQAQNHPELTTWSKQILRTRTSSDYHQTS